MTEHLVVLSNGKVMGEIKKDQRSRLSFIYHRDWQEAVGAYPLSLSMPLIMAEHEHAKIEPWLWGLLPDNDGILARWGQKYQVSPRNVFALLSHVGEDCAGAIQIVLPERVESLVANPTGAVEWLSDNDIADRLKMLRKDQGAWRTDRDMGQFSLAGAQPKTAFFYQNGRWGVPSGRLPTTHIIKPSNQAFDGQAENEHVCLSLAREIGLPAATSEVRSFDGEVAIVVERYDRIWVDETIYRLHQEDICQALGIHPTMKYENQGGPGVQSVAQLLQTYSTSPLEDLWTFVEALAFNWVIGGTDAHAKNYSILISDGRTRLAPLYDISSTLPYDFDFKKLRLAMKIGSKYLLDEISLPDWRKLTSLLRLDQEQFHDRCLGLIDRIPDALSAVLMTARSNGIQHDVLEDLAKALNARTDRCRKVLLS